MPDFPPRYEPTRRLGTGGGGEVWAVRDRVQGEILALKVLASTAGPAEMDALVREAVALSGLEGLGAPRVIAFGTLPDGRHYMVRELAPGRSLEDWLADDDSRSEASGEREGDAADVALRHAGDPQRQPEGHSPRSTRARIVFGAIAGACDQLTTLHRAGLLHGDIKPANLIVADDGSATLVDLGLAAPWREGGTEARGLTPKYAAPELRRGAPLTVRAEVYALGATLSEALARAGDDLDEDARLALAKVAARATDASAEARWPSVDEFASALRRGACLDPAPGDGAGGPDGTSASSQPPPWPVLGVDGAAHALLEAVRALPAGGAVAIHGPAGSGRTTLARRVAWTLGAGGHSVAFIEAPRSALSMREVVALELGDSAESQTSRVVVVDDAHTIDGEAGELLRNASAAGARVAMVGAPKLVAPFVSGATRAFVVPPLPASTASELVQRAVPSLPDALREHLVARTGSRPGALRAAVRALAGRAIVSEADVDRALEGDEARDGGEAAGRGDGAERRNASVPPARRERSRGGAQATVDAEREAAFEEAERELDRGRFDTAARALQKLGDPRGESEKARLGLASARLMIGRGDATRALEELDRVERAASATGRARAWRTLRARACLRAGQYVEAAHIAKAVVEAFDADPCAADALSIRGVALAFTGEDTAARAELDRAVASARALGDPRLEAVALGSQAIAHQRAGRAAAARTDYEAALAAAERAQDAATVATLRLNLAGIAQTEGEIAQALVHLEAAVDMGVRAGSGAAVRQALLNLANLDLYLGRWARARGSIDRLHAAEEELSPAARAQLLGLEAEHAARTGQASRGAALYEETARAWDAQGRSHDAVEARLEAILTRARVPGADPRALTPELDAILASLGAGDLGEHRALAELARGVVAQVAGDEETARRALDTSIEAARSAGRREWAWQGLDARARLAASQGAAATARRDAEAALATLEETATKLPRDLREVFWNDPRRRALRHAAPGAAPSAPISTHTAGVGAHTGGPGVSAHAGSTSIFAGRLAEDRLARILELTRELASEHDIERLLARVTDHAVALLGAERGFVLLVGESGRLEPHTSRNRAGDDDPHARFSRSVAERVVETGDPVVTASARDDERLAHAVSVHQLMIQSIACVPIRGAPPLGRTIGALYVETRLRPGARFEREVPTLGAFADQAAIAIENARLLAENRARADDLARANADLAAARDEIARTLGKRTEQLAEARRDLKQARAELRSHFGYAGLIGTSAAMRKLYAVIERVKDTDVPVLVTGESGTGKEIVARAVHQAGPRSKRPFIGLNCGAIPANLLESELFGSVKGAFTGADRDRPGMLREADGGTLLLDEIGEMPQKMQAGLLRVLQEKRVRPVGAAQEEPVDVRIIAATHRDLAQMVAEGTFREDLYYRLHVIELKVPALRERVEDIPILIDHFLTLFSTRYRRDRKTVSRDALRRLCALPWPGNVRQLEHVLLSTWLMTEGSEIDADDLELPAIPSRPSAISSESRPQTASLSRAPGAPRAGSRAEYKAAERERILSALTASNWNRVQAAKLIGVPRRTFYRRLKEFGIL